MATAPQGLLHRLLATFHTRFSLVPIPSTFSCFAWDGGDDGFDRLTTAPFSQVNLFVDAHTKSRGIRSNVPLQIVVFLSGLNEGEETEKRKQRNLSTSMLVHSLP